MRENKRRRVKLNYDQSGVLNDDYGDPLFSGANKLAQWLGSVRRVGAFDSPFPSGCAVPCNPTWDADTLLEIGGTGSTCCSYTQVDPNVDCVLDDGVWRAVTGEDIPDLSQWGPQHSTNQDPHGENCMSYASGGWRFDQAVYDDCVAQLTVADQRGFCAAPGECPCQKDVCGQKNAGYVPRCQ